MTASLTWLIDTDVVPELMWPRAAPQGGAYFDSIADDGLEHPSVTIWEVFDGNGRLAHGRRRR